MHGKPLFAPEVLASYYIEAGEIFGLRADLLWAQMRLETGELTFTGQVPAQANNFSGLRKRDGSGFYYFATPQDGVYAHAAHLAWHVFPEHVNAMCSTAYDPKHGEHPNDMKTVGDMAIWAAGSPTYVGGILRRANE